MAGTRIESELTGMVWKVEVSVGARVAEGDTLLLLESMKMEIPVTAPCAGVVTEILVAESQPVAEGDALLVMTPE